MSFDVEAARWRAEETRRTEPPWRFDITDLAARMIAACDEIERLRAELAQSTEEAP